MILQKIKTINIVCVIILGSVLTIFNLGFHLDDALIYYRYIENFINGNGLVYNIGERFNALTSPLYIFISIIASSVTREIETTQTILNGILLICSCITIIYIFDELKIKLAGFITSILMITSKYFYTVFGLETNLFIFLTLISILFYLKEEYTVLSIAGALLLLTRGEGIFLILIITYFIYLEHKEILNFKLLIPVAILFLADLLFNHWYYNNFLPHTFFVKIQQGRSGLWGAASFLTQVDNLFDMFNRQPFYIMLLCIFGSIGLIKYYNNRFILILLLFVVLNTAFYTTFNIPNYHWYYSIHFLTFFILAGLGITKVILYLSSKTIHSLVLKVIFVLIFIYFSLTHLEIVRLIINEGPNENYKKMGEWFNKNTPPDSKVAAIEIGHIGWYSKRYIIDILGLTNDYNSKFLANGEYMKWFDFYKPDYIVMHDPFWVYEQSIPRLVENSYFAEDSTFKCKGFKILKSTGKQ